jgi:uncharacterized protein YabN with tetrapyrrole methylase and pyrophosphatase domain
MRYFRPNSRNYSLFIIQYSLNYPHVFGSTVVKSTGEVLENWAQLKAAEKTAIERGDDPYAYSGKSKKLHDKTINRLEKSGRFFALRKD